MKFALKVPAPKAVAVIEHDGWCYPAYDLAEVRDLARQTGKFGFWKRKAPEIRGSDAHERRIAAAQWSLIKELQ